MQKLEPHLSAVARWQMRLVIISLLTITLYFVLPWFKIAPVAAYPAADIPLLVGMLLGGVPLVLQILCRLFRGDLGADLLAALSLVIAAWLGQYLAGMLIVLMLSGGQVLEAYAMRKASSVLLALSERMPAVAHRKQGVHIDEIALADIQIGDAIVVYPHETAPVDGVVIEGHGSMDESYLTGEPYCIAKAPGASVLSGTVNGEAVLVLRAERLPADSRYAKIMEVMQEAQQKRPTLRRLGDRLGAVFAPLALLFALGVWYQTGSAMRFLAVLMMATPCPLLIAIPITLISAISLAARRGIIIKDPTVLERLPTCRTAIFDKTGTLTYGRAQLVDIIVAEGFVADEILQQVASLERYSKHPLASAILQAAQTAKLMLLEASSITEDSGNGLTGIVGGHSLLITHRQKLLQIKPEMESMLPPSSTGLECMILQDGIYAAIMHFRDVPRSDGKSFISHLAPAHHFHKIMLVSGDRESEVSYLAELLGIKETFASQSPAQKLAIVRAEVAKTPTLFMGDGINDAPALTAATVGIAFGQQQSNVTAEAAGAVIMESSLTKVDELIHLSTAMYHIALQSAVGGMLLSVMGMGFAAGGFISPVMSAVLQEVIDVLAIINALRLIWSNTMRTDFSQPAATFSNVDTRAVNR